MSDPQSPANGGAKPKNLSRRGFMAGAATGGAVAIAGAYAINDLPLGEGSGFKARGFSRARPIVTNTGPLPARVDAVVIGGGFLGVSTALSLAQRGLSVALLEKGVVAGEASGRSAGMVESILNGRSQLDLIEYSKQRWRRMNQIIGEETGFMQHGNTVLYTDGALLGAAKDWLDGVRDLPHAGARMLSAAEAAAIAPGAKVKLAGGIHAPEDGSAEPTLAAPAIALGAMKLGARIHQNCAVRGIETSGGRVSGVVTEKGIIKTSHVVLAGGVWSPVLARGLGLDLPMVQGWVSMASVLPFENAPPPGNVSLIGPNVGWRRQFDGGYAVWQYAAIGPVLPDGVSHLRAFLPLLKANWSLVGIRFSFDTFVRWMNYGHEVPLDRPGVFETMRVYEPDLRLDVIDKGITRLRDTVPAFANAAVDERWTGAMSMTPDTKPVLSEVRGVPGLVMATGFYHGLTVGPGAGEIAADLVTGKTPAINISAFRYERLIDGSKLDIYS